MLDRGQREVVDGIHPRILGEKLLNVRAVFGLVHVQTFGDLGIQSTDFLLVVTRADAAARMVNVEFFFLARYECEQEKEVEEDFSSHCW